MDNSHEFFDRYGERTLEKLLGMASGYVYNFTDSTLGSFFADLNVDIHGEKYRSAGKPMAGTPDIPALTKETLKELKLVPEGIPDSARGSDITKRLLQNLGTIGNNLAELRGLYGTGHGKHGKTEGHATPNLLSVPHQRLPPSFLIRIKKLPLAKASRRKQRAKSSLAAGLRSSGHHSKGKSAFGFTARSNDFDAHIY